MPADPQARTPEIAAAALAGAQCGRACQDGGPVAAISPVVSARSMRSRMLTTHGAGAAGTLLRASLFLQIHLGTASPPDPGGDSRRVRRPGGRERGPGPPAPRACPAGGEAGV